jgi:hypothetical protein
VLLDSQVPTPLMLIENSHLEEWRRRRRKNSI